MHYKKLINDIKQWGSEIGFASIGITRPEISAEEQQKLQNWLAEKHHAEMRFMERTLSQRLRPNELMSEVKSIICVAVSIDKLPKNKIALDYDETIASQLIARFALKVDYHQFIHDRLLELANKISAAIGKFKYRICVDSSPVMEKSLAVQANLGWRGKNTLMMNESVGSFLCLGEMYTDLLLPPSMTIVTIVETPCRASLQYNDNGERCDHCNLCVASCPTQALSEDGKLDARKCIAYWTILHKGIIPPAIRPLIGCRIFGCDHCQLVCPCNNLVSSVPEADKIIAMLWQFSKWTEEEFNWYTKGTSIEILGYDRWQRNVAVAMGNNCEL